jgi:hypothetical protein
MRTHWVVSPGALLPVCIGNVNETGLISPHVEQDADSWQQALPDDANSFAAAGNYRCKRRSVKKGGGGVLLNIM